MDIKNRKDAFLAPESLKSHFFSFERELYHKKCCSLEEILRFFEDEGFISMKDVMEGLKPHIQSSKTLSDLVLRIMADDSSYKWGEPLGCDFQVMKSTRMTTKTTPFPQRYHCRAYIFDDEFVIISERETSPHNISSKIVHVAEGKGIGYQIPEHRKIRIKRCESILQKLRYYFLIHR